MADPSRARRAQPAIVRSVAIGGGFTPLQDLYHFVITRPWWQFFALVAVGFVLTNTVFGLLYYASPGCIANAPSGGFADAFFFSVQTMATIGYGAMAPANVYAHVIVTLEAVIGVLVTAVATGLTFAKFAVPRANVVFSDKAVIGTRNGVPSLMFRMANARRNSILEAQLRVILLQLERTEEGESWRRPVPIKLVRDTTPLMTLTWTAVHAIDETSPFHGDGLARLRAEKADIFLSLIGIDETLSQTVHARWRYTIDDIVEGARFADIVSVRDDGTRVVDYRKMHDVELLPARNTNAPGAP